MSEAEPHGPLLTVQVKVCVPTAKPVIVVVGLEGEAMVPGPVHVPVAGVVAGVAAMVTRIGPAPAQNS